MDADPIPPTGLRRNALAWIAAGVLASIVAAAWVLSLPTILFLLPHAGAEWVRVDRPFDIIERYDPVTRAAFVTTIDVPPAFAGATLQLRAVRTLAAILIDGRTIFNGVDGDWREPLAIRLPALPAGRHELRLDVADPHGPALIWARCDAIGLRTGTGVWRGTEYAGVVGPGGEPPTWHGVAAADLVWTVPVADAYPRAWRAVLTRLPWLAVAFAAGAGGHLYSTRAGRRGRGDVGRRVCLAVVAAWVVLGANNVRKLPPRTGYDVDEHVKTVRWVAENHRVPLPTQGWQMYHPPLFYLLAAAVYRLLGSGADAVVWLRLLPLACGTTMAVLCHRAGRHVFPDRPDLAAVAAVAGGLLPMNLYMGQAVSNEPLAACLAGGAGVVAMGLLTPGRTGRRWRLHVAAVGLLLGLAGLTKLSGLLWFGPVAAAVGVAAVRRRPTTPRSAGIAAAAAVLGVAVVVCGPYYVRNLVRTGAAFYTRSPGHRGDWWQDPGYHTPADLLRFGSALEQPALPGIPRLWDGVYATLWGDGQLNSLVVPADWHPFHFGWVAAGLWLGVPMTAWLFIGVGRGLWRGPAALRFAVGMVGLYLAGLVYFCLAQPFYSAPKASYALATTPCLAALIAAGFEVTTRARAARAVGVGLLACWAAAAYAAYFT